MGLLERLAALVGLRDAGPSPDPARPSAPRTPEENRPNALAEQLLKQICVEAITGSQDRARGDLSASARWRRLKDAPPEFQAAVARAAFEVRGRDSQVQNLHTEIVAALLRRKLPFEEAFLLGLLDAWNRRPHGYDPGRLIIGAVERHVDRAGISPELRRALLRIAEKVRYGNLALRERIAILLGTGAAADMPWPPGAFAKRLRTVLKELGEEDRAHWTALARLSLAAADKSKPTRAWLTDAGAHVDAVGTRAFGEQLLRFFDQVVPDPPGEDGSLDILRGLIWLSPRLEHVSIAGPLGRFAEICLRKAPGFAARSVKLGNAAIWALSQMDEEPAAAAELLRLGQKVKTATGRKNIDNLLQDLARKRGQSVQEMHDQALEDFGLDADGRLTAVLGAARAELTLTATGLDVAWFNAAGRPVKSVPGDLRTAHAGDLAAFRRRVKDIEDARAAQVQRLEQAWIDDRSWSLADWRARYLSHPLRRPIVEALIWRIGTHDVLPTAGILSGIDGVAVEFPDDARVTLWHPLNTDPAQVLAWRQRILDLEVTQPIKQAHREVYVLTDAERATRIYSNRFAAHILRQHQFRALCQARGWSYALIGAWDAEQRIPVRALPSQGLTVTYQVDAVEDGRHSDVGVYLHVASDQIRFEDGRGAAVELESVPPVVFSEVLRDVDLFVAVTSVANDPRWTDGGPDGPNGRYWREWAFGELGQTGAARRELITWLAPRLSIADRLEVTDRFLLVRGKRQSYAIHLGSGNVQILPSNRYLCIVPDHAPDPLANVKLPFTGDGTLSAILAKAFLLVDEDNIRDPTILQQL